ncbi:hypothetical protein P4O66_007893, partial [Electrophorus voltai]
FSTRLCGTSCGGECAMTHVCLRQREARAQFVNNGVRGTVGVKRPSSPVDSKALVEDTRPEGVSSDRVELTGLDAPPTDTHRSYMLCEVCNIQLNSAAQAQIHYNGKTHQKRLKYISSGTSGRDRVEWEQKPELFLLEGVCFDVGGGLVLWCWRGAALDRSLKCLLRVPERRSELLMGLLSTLPSQPSPLNSLLSPLPMLVTISGHVLMKLWVLCTGAAAQGSTLLAAVPVQARPLHTPLELKNFLPFRLSGSSALSLFPNFNTMDPVQKAVINHTFGVPQKKKQVISCNICHLRFNSTNQAEAHYKGHKHARKLKALEAQKTKHHRRQLDGSVRERVRGRARVAEPLTTIHPCTTERSITLH